MIVFCYAASTVQVILELTFCLLTLYYYFCHFGKFNAK